MTQRAFRWAGLACSLLVLCSGVTARAQAGQQPSVRVEMNADRPQLTMNDQVGVRIYVQTQGQGQPDIEVPEFEGFQVVQRAVQRPMQFSFGFGQAQPVVTSTTQYTFLLVPMGPGTFKIPPVKVTVGQKVYQSQPLVLTVTGRGAPGQAPAQPGTQADAQSPQPAAADPTPAPQATGDASVFDQDAFLRTVVDKLEPYEGEQVTTTIYLYTRHNLQQVPAVQNEASTDGFWVHDLLSATRSLEPTRQVVNGRGFWVYVLRRFAGFPLRSGDLTIGSMTLTVSRESIFDLFDPNRGPSELRRSSVPVQLKVKPLPSEGKPAGQIAVGTFSIEAKLDRAQVMTGDAATLTVNVKGLGNLRGVRIADPVVNGLQILQPELHDLVEAPNDRVQGSRNMAWLIVPQTPGPHVIPSLSLDTFDPERGAYKRIGSAPLMLTAAGAARAGASPSPDKTSPGEPARDSDEPAEIWPTIHTKSELERAQTPLASHGLYGIAVAFFPATWLLSVLLPGAWTRLRRRGDETGERAAMRGARKRLSAAESALAANDARRFHADVASALQATLEARLGETVSGLTQGELRAKLAERGMPESLSRALCEILAQCDFARFSSAAVSAADMQGLLAKAEQLWSEVASFSPAKDA